MEIRNEKNHVFNIKLSKLTGLYQLLDPGTVKYLGRNVYHIAIVCVLLYMCLFSLISILSSLYYWTANISISMDYFWKSETTLYIIYKIYFVVCHSKEIWNCLSITRYDFTSFKYQNRHVILDRWRERLAWLTTIYAIMYLTATVSYLVITLAFSKDKLPVKNHDGSIGYYRQNAMNFYIIVSDGTYNAHYYMFYFIEALFVGLTGLFFFIFDFLLVTLCFGMCCQMQIICSAFESVGHKSLRGLDSPIGDDSKDENIKIPPNGHDLNHNELKTIINDHQAVMEKYEIFLTLFRRVMLLHIFVSSLTVIALLFTFIMSFSNDDRFKTSEVTIVKMFCSIPSIFFQIFMVCYLYGSIHDQNDSIIFALYSSNWTEMDMKFKKLVLLTMKLNNANNKSLKFTRTKIVNLEMCFKTMGDCYTIISVLVKYLSDTSPFRTYLWSIGLCFRINEVKLSGFVNNSSAIIMRTSRSSRNEIEFGRLREILKPTVQQDRKENACSVQARIFYLYLLSKADSNFGESTLFPLNAIKDTIKTFLRRSVGNKYLKIDAADFAAAARNELLDDTDEIIYHRLEDVRSHYTIMNKETGLNEGDKTVTDLITIGLLETEITGSLDKLFEEIRLAVVRCKYLVPIHDRSSAAHDSDDDSSDPDEDECQRRSLDVRLPKKPNAEIVTNSRLWSAFDERMNKLFSSESQSEELWSLDLEQPWPSNRELPSDLESNSASGPSSKLKSTSNSEVLSPSRKKKTFN
ncbi:hypothetical protein QTP88_027739 [Uroleucon formosanum]